MRQVRRLLTGMIVAGMVLTVPAHAMEYVVTGDRDAQAAWQALKTMVDSLKERTSGISGQVSTLNGNLDGLKTRLDNVDKTSGVLNSTISLCGQKSMLWDGNACKNIYVPPPQPVCHTETTQVTACGTVPGCPGGWVQLSYYAGGLCRSTRNGSYSDMIATCMRMVCQ